MDNVGLPYGKDSASQQEKVTAFQGRPEVLKTQNEEMYDKLLDMNAENNKYRQKLERLIHENKRLKQSPLFVAAVQEIAGEGVIIKQHGNNQKTLTEVTDGMHGKLEPDACVAMSNFPSIARRLDKETNARTHVMQVERSPGVIYEDIGGPREQIQEVRETVEVPLDRPEIFAKIGIDPPPGVLLYSPPSTEKTMLARAVASQTGASFIKMTSSELVHRFIGEGTKLVCDLFEVARENKPAVIFIDEINAITSKWTGSEASGGAEAQRTATRLLAEMDGFDEHGNVHIVAAANRFNMLDPAILRPNRFDHLIEVSKPNEDGHEIVFQIRIQKMSVSDDMGFVELARIADNASDVDIKVVYTEAGMSTIRDDRTEVFVQNLIDAWEKIQREASDEIGVSCASA